MANAWLVALARATYGKQLEEFEQIVRQANVERGAQFIKALRAEYPMAATMVDAALNQTPQQALDTLAEYCPAVRDIPNAVETIRRLQEKLHAEINKPRSSFTI